MNKKEVIQEVWITLESNFDQVDDCKSPVDDENDGNKPPEARKRR